MNKQRIIKLISSQLIVMIILIALERFVIDRPFSLDRFLILYVFFGFLMLHLLIKPKEIWKFIYKKRYYIALILLIFCVSNKYHMSSMGIWNQVVPSENAVKNSDPFLGIPRSIRSDEWMVSTPAVLSQGYTNNPYSKYNNIIMGNSLRVSLFPSLPTKRIFAIGNLFSIGYLFLDTSGGFSFNWMTKIIVLLLVSFEFCMIITKGNKLYSLLGMFLIGFSPMYHWWTSIDYIIWGEMAICFLYKFIHSNKNWHKFFWSVGIGIIGLNYLMGMYPAWQIPFGYLFAIFVFWLIIKNKDKLKWNDLLYLFPILIVMFGLFIPLYLENKDTVEITMNTVYPGARFSTGGDSWQLLFNYFSTIFYPFKNLNNPCENAQFISLFPIPIILGLYYTIKNFKSKKHDGLILSLCILSLILFSFNIISFPKIIAKISLLFMSTPSRTQSVISYIMVLLIVLIMSRYEEKKEKKGIINIISIIIIAFIVSFGMTTTINIIDAQYMTKIMIVISAILFTILMYLFIQNVKKYNKYLAIMLIIVTFISGGTINPISKGLSVFYEKPLAKEIQKIVAKDRDAKWITVNSWHLQNYLITNGASTINSTNYHPNLNLWKKIDPEGKYNFVYNRYAHIVIQLVDDESNFVLNYPDSITLNLNYDNICTLNAKYIVSTNNLDLEKINVELIYSELGINIYKTKC